jgi:phenylpropionate dioxygenase-like ring-hydroxylating dioxygenase large terminal subunit
LLCRAYRIGTVIMNEILPPDLAQGETQHDPEEFQSLPGWLYHDAEFFAYEAERVFRPSWQVVCHVNDIPNAGDYVTLDYLGESIVALRGDDGPVRALHNVCRHRAARLLDGPAGRCRFRLSCSYHGWSYDLRGRLAGVPLRETFVGLDMAAHGLKPVEHEVYHGFIFIRLAGAGPSVVEMMSPYEAEIAAYRMEEMVPLGRLTLRPRAVNWKNISDNYSDSLHINVAHPGLTRLFGKGYGIEASEWVHKMWGRLRDVPSSNRSERMYQRYLPRVAHLSEDRQRLWVYFKLWPNVAFDIYPDQIDFMQFVPVSATSTMIREIAYVHPDARREMKAARYLNWRINRQVNKEDTDLINRVQAGMTSSSYEAGPLGATEVCLRQFARKLRALAPMARERRAPAPGWSRGAQ